MSFTTWQYEVEYFVPGDRLNPPRKPERGEWWAASGSSTGMTSGRFTLIDAQRERVSYRRKLGYRTRLIEIQTRTTLLEEDA